MWLKAAVIVFFVAFADCFLTPSQPACVGDVIEYNCSYVDSFMQWNYNAERIHASSIATLGSVRVTTSGIEFNISYGVNNDMIMSTIRFKVTEASNNSEVTCMGLNLVNVAMETIHVIYPGINANIRLVATFINTTYLNISWIPELGVLYSINSTMAWCMSFSENAALRICEVEQYSLSHICLTAESKCNNNVTVICTDIVRPVGTLESVTDDVPNTPELNSNHSFSSYYDQTVTSGTGNLSTMNIISFGPVDEKLSRAVIGGSVGAAILSCIFVVTIIVIVLLYRKYFVTRSSHSKKQKNCEILQISEYSTTSHSFGTSNIPTSNEDEYSKLQHETKVKNNRKKLSYTLYADLQRQEQSETHQAFEVPVVYSDIKGTVSSLSDVDSTLDLNSVVLQISSVKQSWKILGNALDVPNDILCQIESMEMEYRDKLVEMLDYWIHMHSKDSQPTWKEISRALQLTGHKNLAEKILDFYTTGYVPVQCDELVTPLNAETSFDCPPPIPPKMALSRDGSDADVDLYFREVHVHESDINKTETPPPRPPKLKI